MYIHTTGAPTNTVLEATTFQNSGQRFLVSITYDSTPVLGARDLLPADGVNYITIPNNNPAGAVKVFEFKGCREQIPINTQPFSIQNASCLSISLELTTINQTPNLTV